MQKERINIAFVTMGDAKDVSIWSGTTSHIAKALERQQLVKIYYIDNIKYSRNYLLLAIGKIYSKILKIFGKQYLYGYTLNISKTFAKEIVKRLPKDTDVIFAPAGCMYMAFLKTDLKKIMYNDSTYSRLIDYLNYFTNLSKQSLKEIKIIEKKSIENCDLLLYTSDWAANSAIEDYKVNPSKIKIVPFGTNIEKEYSDVEIQNFIKSRPTNRCNLLFVGLDWKQKGGDIAIEIANQLYLQNIDVHLDIVGIKNIPVPLPNYVTNHNFISKKTEEGINKLTKLFENAHFFVLPTRRECFGIVFAEASTFAVPSLATKTGGVEAVVKDNINGMTFELSDSPKKYSDYITTLFNNREEYEKLCLSTFNYYKTRLNWNTAAEQIIAEIREICKTPD